MSLLVTFAVAAAGGLVGLWLRIPAGPMIGAMLAVAVGRSLRSSVQPLPVFWRHAGRVLLGAVIGSSFTPAVLVQVLGLALPAAILITLLFISGLIGGMILTRRAGLDPGTALFACMPGGIAEMTTASEVAGYDSGVVATIQFLRITAIVTLVPLVLGWLSPLVR